MNLTLYGWSSTKMHLRYATHWGQVKKNNLAVYLQILNFRPHLRSYVDQSQLVMLCLEKDFKYLGQEKVFGPLLNDLHHII